MLVDKRQLSKTISYALRHAPWEYELELDIEGWVKIDDLLLSLKSEKPDWKNLCETDLTEIIKISSKKRFEIKDKKIRALYGHSVPNKLIKELSEPPEILYHGTSPETAEIILRAGLKPMGRQYVHLSVDTEMAKQVASRKSKKPVILLIDSKKSFQNGNKFYIGNEHVWLADDVPAKHIKPL